MRHRWIEGKVDQESEYIGIFYSGNLDSITARDNTEIMTLVASCGGEITVQFPENLVEAEKEEIIKELDFYFVELEKEDPWEYAKYHCSTASNLYSSVRWVFYPAK